MDSIGGKVLIGKNDGLVEKEMKLALILETVNEVIGTQVNDCERCRQPETNVHI